MAEAVIVITTITHTIMFGATKNFFSRFFGLSLSFFVSSSARGAVLVTLLSSACDVAVQCRPMNERKKSETKKKCFD